MIAVLFSLPLLQSSLNHQKRFTRNLPVVYKTNYQDVVKGYNFDITGG